jgi:hypothetical protein
MPTPATITATLMELLDAEVALQVLLEAKVRPAIAYHLATLMRLVRVETAQFQTQRDAMVRELGVPSGDQIVVAEDQRAEFGRRITELSQVEVTLHARPLTLEDLPDLTAADVLRLGPLLTV